MASNKFIKHFSGKFSGKLAIRRVMPFALHILYKMLSKHFKTFQGIQLIILLLASIQRNIDMIYVFL